MILRMLVPVYGIEHLEFTENVVWSSLGTSCIYIQSLLDSPTDYDIQLPLFTDDSMYCWYDVISIHKDDDSLSITFTSQLKRLSLKNYHKSGNHACDGISKIGLYGVMYFTTLK